MPTKADKWLVVTHYGPDAGPEVFDTHEEAYEELLRRSNNTGENGIDSYVAKITDHYDRDTGNIYSKEKGNE